MKHTPGPWFQSEQRTKPHKYALIGIGNGACLTPAMNPFEAEGHYHANCSCCWLGFSHTLALHNNEAVVRKAEL